MSRATTFLDTSKKRFASNSELSTLFNQINDLYRKKLWHQLTQKLEILVKNPALDTEDQFMIELYECFLQDFEFKINELRAAKIIVRISNHFRDTSKSIEFLTGIFEKMKNHKEANLYLSSAIAAYMVELKDKKAETKQRFDQLKSDLEGSSNIDIVVYQVFYQALASYWKSQGVDKSSLSEFYEAAFNYSTFIALSEEPLSSSAQQELAYNVVVAAIAGENVYNFAELVEKPFLNSLKGSTFEWLLSFLQAFHLGDLLKFNQILEQNSAAFDTLNEFSSNKRFIRDKIAILALVELVFKRPSQSRTVDFNTISSTCQVSSDEVELLVMRALSLGIVKGEINEVAQQVCFTWVQPRLLSLAQVGLLKDHLTNWSTTINEMRKLVEENTHELFS